MPKIDLFNFVPYLAGSREIPEPMEQLSPRVALERVRASCSEKGDSLEAWSKTLVENCVIPSEHPFRALMNAHMVPAEDPLWTLGAIAYGTESHWVVIRRIVWDDGTSDSPDELERAWTIKGGSAL